MKPTSIAYFGSPDFSALFLERIVTDQDLKNLVKVKLVVTQPDRPKGRKQILTPTPVKKMAQKYNLKVVNRFVDDAIGGAKRGAPSSAQPKRALERAIEQQNLLHDLEVDLGLVFAYKNIIPSSFLSQPKYGFLNIHPSLLPQYRGPSPIASPLIKGDPQTGVTIIRMDEKIDHGPIISQRPIAISSSDRRPDLEKKLTTLAFSMMKKIFIAAAKKPNILTQPGTPQDHSQATYTHRLHRQDGFIPLKEIATLLRTGEHKARPYDNLFRGLYPWPGIWTKIKIKGQEKRLKILDLEKKNNQLVIKKVQLEGKRPVDWQTFIKAYNNYFLRPYPFFKTQAFSNQTPNLFMKMSS